MDRIIRPPDYLPTDMSKVFCVDSRRHAWRSVWTEAQREEDNSTSGLPSNGNELGILRGQLMHRLA